MPLTFIHITDTHVGETPGTLVNNYGAGRALQAVLHHIAQNDGHGASFIAHTGDLARDSYHPAAYEGGKRIYGLKGDACAPGPLQVTAAGLNLDWYYIPGNSDHRPECLARLFPRSPAVRLFNYAWEVRSIRFLSLDWGAWRMDNYLLVPDSFDWLREQLQTRTPTVVLTHHPPVHVGVEMFDAMTPPDLHRLQDLIADSSVLAVFHGHTHYPWENRIGRVPVFGTGSVTYRRCLHQSGGEESILEIHPPQYRVVTIGDEGTVSAPVCEVPLAA